MTISISFMYKPKPVDIFQCISYILYTWKKKLLDQISSKMQCAYIDTFFDLHCFFFFIWVSWLKECPWHKLTIWSNIYYNWCLIKKRFLDFLTLNAQPFLVYNVQFYQLRDLSNLLIKCFLNCFTKYFWLHNLNKQIYNK